MIQYNMRALCLKNGNLTAKQLDQAVKFCKGKKEITLDEPSHWDSWFIPEDKQIYVSLFVTHMEDLYIPHPIKVT